MITSETLFIAAAFLAFSATVALIPLMIRFKEEGRKAGVNFHGSPGALLIFRPQSLPSSMASLARKIRIYAGCLLWPAFALLCIAWIMSI
jgi:hypothetical protein